MAQCAIKLRNYPSKTVRAGKGRTVLTSDLDTMIALDTSDTIAQTMSCELEQQESFGNEPTNLIINNGRGPQTIRTLTGVGGRTSPSALVFKAQAFFGQPQEMVDAARDAWVLFQALTRIRTGTALRNYMFYVGKVGEDKPGKPIGKGFSGFSMLKSQQLTDESTVSIVGPLTTYGRKLYWNPKGGKTVAKRFPGTREASRKLGISIRGGFIGTATMHNDVKKRMRRKARYKSFSFSDPFYFVSPRRIVGTYPETMKRPTRMPAITIQMKKQGRLR